jgi:hypothetical protein
MHSSGFGGREKSSPLEREPTVKVNVLSASLSTIEEEGGGVGGWSVSFMRFCGCCAAAEEEASADIVYECVDKREREWKRKFEKKI